MRRLSILLLATLVLVLPAQAAEKKKSHYKGCPAGLTFAPDFLKKISWARGVWGFPGLGYRPPKEWNCKG
jgi:hypothetical protein